MMFNNYERNKQMNKQLFREHGVSTDIVELLTDAQIEHLDKAIKRYRQNGAEKKPKLDVIALHRFNMPKNSSLPILEELLVDHNKLYSSDLENVLCTPTPTGKFEKGIYAIIGKEIFKQKEDIENFPTVRLESTGQVKVLSELILGEFVIADLIRAANFASNDCLRPAMCQVMLASEKGRLVIASTDGHRLFHKETTVRFPSNESYLIPTKLTYFLSKVQMRNATLQHLLHTVKTDTQNIVDGKKEDGFIETPYVRVLLDNDVTYTSKVCSEKYPDYKSIMPTEAEVLYTVDRKELLRTVQYCEQFASAATRLVAFHVAPAAPKIWEISAEDIDFGKSIKKDFPLVKSEKVKKPFYSKRSALLMPVRINANGPGCFGFNAEYLKDVLRALTTEHVIISQKSMESAHIFSEVN